MKIHCKYTGIRGFLTVYDRAVRYAYMITAEAKMRLKILEHWKKHGMESAIHAFDTKERTLWEWKARLDKGGGKPEALNLKSNIERLIVDMGGLRTFPQKITGTGKVKRANRKKVLRKPKDLIPQYPGHVVALDTIEKQRNGRRMYILTAIDIYSRTTFSIATKSHSSKTFAHFFYLIMQMFPYEVKNVLTDNGSEFKLHPDALLTKNNITHYHTYPKTPKMNAHCESFNGTIQEEFVDYNTNLLFDDTTKFNEKLSKYLGFYNTKRVHCSFNNKLAPLEVLVRSDYYVSKLPAECRNGWGYS